MIVYIYCYERYPAYLLEDADYGGFVGEVPEETVTRWKAAIAEFDKVQEEMGKLFERK